MSAPSYSQILSCDKYVKVDAHELMLRRLASKGTLDGIARRLAEALDDTSVRSSVKKSDWQPKATEVAQIQLRCKYQKDPGSVWFRVITGNALYRFKSLGLWVADRARTLLRQHGNDH